MRASLVTGWGLIATTMLTPAESMPAQSWQFPAMARAPQCPEGCPHSLWPRVIVGVIPPPNSDTEVDELVRVRFRDQQGEMFEGISRGCREIPGILCSFSFFSSPRDHTITLLIENRDASGLAAEANISLRPFNYCGQDIAYVVVRLTPARRPEIEAPQFISGCSTRSSRSKGE